MFSITRDWGTAALDPGVWYSTVCEGRGLEVYSRVGEGEGKGVRKPAEEERMKRKKRRSFCRCSSVFFLPVQQTTYRIGNLLGMRASSTIPVVGCKYDER